MIYVTDSVNVFQAPVKRTTASLQIRYLEDIHAELQESIEIEGIDKVRSCFISPILKANGGNLKVEIESIEALPSKFTVYDFLLMPSKADPAADDWVVVTFE